MSSKRIEQIVGRLQRHVDVGGGFLLLRIESLRLERREEQVGRLQRLAQIVARGGEELALGAVGARGFLVCRADRLLAALALGEIAHAGAIAEPAPLIVVERLIGDRGPAQAAVAMLDAKRDVVAAGLARGGTQMPANLRTVVAVDQRQRVVGHVQAFFDRVARHARDRRIDPARLAAGIDPALPVVGIVGDRFEQPFGRAHTRLINRLGLGIRHACRLSSVIAQKG